MVKKNKIFLVLNIVLFLFVFISLGQAQMTPKEILEKADEARGSYQGMQAEISMESIELGRRQYRIMKVYEKGYNCFIDTTAPSNVKGQRILMRERNLWYSNPGLTKPIPVSPRQKLMGTAVNGDIVSTNYTGDYKITGTEDSKVNGENCILMHLEAVDNRATYDRIKYWISKERLLGLKAEFYTVSGKMFKSAMFEYKNSIVVNGKPREFISKSIITSAIIKGDYTTIHYIKPALKHIPDAKFNVNLMTR